MAYYYSIPIEEMEEELESLRFYPVNLVFRNKPVKEWVYERKLPRSKNHFVRIYTGIQRYGQSAGESRKAGKDAIRIQVIYRDAKGETLVSQTKRVHRVGGWRKNLHKRMDEVATELPQVEFDSRGEPMTLRKKGKNKFWGSRDYPKFNETKPFRAEEIRCCKECDKTTGLTTIQTGTYCYDCLPINLGAEDDYNATYGVEQATIRRKLKNKIKKQAIMGTKAGQWSARKSQELKRQYEAACDKKGLNSYKGKKTKSQDNLSKWSKQKWGTASGKKSSTTGEPYFPAKAVAALKKKDLYAKAKRQKAKATRAGKQNARYSDDIRKVVAQYRAESPEWDDVDWDSEVPPKYKDEEWVEEIEWDAEDEEITMKEFDDTTAEDFVEDSDDRIVLMLRKKSKINRYGDVGCPVCGSIGLFSEDIIAKGKKWYCFGCLYEDKEETIKGKGDITLEKYGLEITCPICKKSVKAFNNDSMLRHMKKCGVSE